ncbi:MAG: tetratricopeptide repeat protein [Alistipes sp.]|nr:tetratricopeptide repeat protein [Alistipes sp.]
MTRITKYISTVVVMLLMLFVGAESLSAQYHKERRLVREGNSNFEKNNFNTSYNRYNEALEHDATNYEALYNRANAYHHLRRTNPQDSTLTAQTTFRNYEAIAADTLLSDMQRAEVLRNLGESLFSEEKYEAALNAFRESLRLNPDDKETKYDYVLAKRIVDQKRMQQQQNQNQDNDQQNENNDQQNEQNEQNKDNQQNKDNPEQQQNPEADKPEEQNDNQQQKPDEEQGEDEEREGEQPQPKELSSDQERMLNAIQAEEDKTQEKLKEAQKALVIPGKKNW